MARVHHQGATPQRMPLADRPLKSRDRRAAHGNGTAFSAVVPSSGPYWPPVDPITREWSCPPGPNSWPLNIPAAWPVPVILRRSPDHRASPVRVASLETGFSFKTSVEESEQPASTSRHASFGERFLFDLASFDERFAGGDISVAETEDGDSNVLNYAHLPSPGPGEHASQSVTGRSTPKLAPTDLLPPASPARKRVATAEASKHSISPADDDSRTAIYDIAARTVYLPNGSPLEAHSGLGDHMDDARYVHLKRLGPTPPNSYKLVMREEPFHGVRAIRLVPVGD